MCAVFPSALYGILRLRHVNVPEPYYYAWGTLLFIALLSIICPPFGNFLHKTGEKIGGWLGKQIARVILFIIYILSVIPTGMLMKIVKRDRLKLKKPDVSSYWVDNKEEEKDYEYQF